GAGAADMSGVVKVPLVGGRPASPPRHLTVPSAQEAAHRGGMSSNHDRVRAGGPNPRVTGHADRATSHGEPGPGHPGPARGARAHGLGARTQRLVAQSLALADGACSLRLERPGADIAPDNWGAAAFCVATGH